MSGLWKGRCGYLLGGRETFVEMVVYKISLRRGVIGSPNVDIFLICERIYRYDAPRTGFTDIPWRVFHANEYSLLRRPNNEDHPVSYDSFRQYNATRLPTTCDAYYTYCARIVSVNPVIQKAIRRRENDRKVRDHK